MGNYLFPPPDPSRVLLDKKRRITYAALSGLLAGATCSVVLIFINTWLYPDLPIYIDPLNALILAAFWTLGAGIFAGGAAYTTEGWGSIILSSAVMGAAILILNFLQGTSNLFLNAVVLAGLLVPFTGMITPFGYLFFRIAERFVQLHDLTGWARWKIILVNGVIIILAGALPGMYTKFSARAEGAVYMVHELLQENASAASPDALSKPLLKTKHFMEHRAQPYTLSQAQSRASTAGVDVTAHYADGYLLTCTAVLYPKQEPYFVPCTEKLP